MSRRGLVSINGTWPSERLCAGSAPRRRRRPSGHTDGRQLSRHRRQRDGGLAVVQRRGRQQVTDRSLALGHVDVQLVADPRWTCSPCCPSSCPRHSRSAGRRASLAGSWSPADRGVSTPSVVPHPSLRPSPFARRRHVVDRLGHQGPRHRRTVLGWTPGTRKRRGIICSIRMTSRVCTNCCCFSVSGPNTRSNGLKLTADELGLYQEWIENNRELERLVKEMRRISSRVLALITGRQAP